MTLPSRSLARSVGFFRCSGPIVFQYFVVLVLSETVLVLELELERAQMRVPSSTSTSTAMLSTSTKSVQAGLNRLVHGNVPSTLSLLSL